MNKFLKLVLYGFSSIIISSRASYWDIWGLTIIAGFSSAVFCNDRFCPFQWHPPVPLFLSCSWERTPFEQDLTHFLKDSPTLLIATAGRLLWVPFLAACVLSLTFMWGPCSLLRNKDGPNCSVWVQAMMWVIFPESTCAIQSRLCRRPHVLYAAATRLGGTYNTDTSICTASHSYRVDTSSAEISSRNWQGDKVQHEWGT